MNDEEVTSEILLMDDEVTSEISLDIHTGSRPDKSKLIKPIKVVSRHRGYNPISPLFVGRDKINKLIKLKQNLKNICLLIT